MIEAQIAQLAAAPLLDKGKILGQLEDLETIAYYYIQPSIGRWIDFTLPKKKSDPGRPIIPIAIGPHIFKKLSVTSEQVSTLSLR